jgi:hypothetical protein
MSKKREMETVFSENLDNVLAGKPIRADMITDAEILSALDFAGKIAKFRPTISEQYRISLKASLLRKLEIQEMPAKKNNGRSWNILRQPVWQAVTAVFLFILIISIVWRAGVFNLSMPASSPTTTTIPTYTTTPTTVPTTGTLFSIDVKTNKSVYQSGELVKINLSMRNISSQQLKLDKLPPILSVMRSDTGKPVYTFSGGQDTRTLGYGETIQFTYSWNQADFHGQTVTGSYYIELEDLEYQGQAIQLHPTQPVSFEIQSDSVQ